MGNQREKLIAAAERFGISVVQMPRHIAIIMDGNGRWAQQRGLPRFEGHSEGAKRVEKIALDCVAMGVECLTIYSFSMQNWKRPKAEVDFLMYLYEQYLEGIRPMLMKNNVRLVHLGRTKELPGAVTRALAGTIKRTAKNSGMVLAMALNYGARTEIADAVRKIAQEYKANKLRLKDIDEQCVSERLYTAKLGEPDLLIRTANEMRISNFLLWQISYSEFYVTKTLWPDFKRRDLIRAIRAYASRQRRFGGLKTK